MVNATTIKNIQDIMRKDVGVDGDAQRIGQLVWMLFLKVFDDREREWEALEPGYISPIPEGLRWRDWAAGDEGLTGDELSMFVNSTLFPRMKELPGTDSRSELVRGVFGDAYNYMKSGTLLRQVINKINADLDFNRSHDRHVFGDLYEQLLRDLQSAGNAGEYYTPRAVTEFMVRMLDPRPGEVVLDPACGTGGFLTCALEHMRLQYVRSAEDERLAQQSIRGVEKKQLPHLLCTTNMILHGIDVPSGIRHDNTLSRPLRSYGPSDKVDVIITNPPFGGIEEDGIEQNFPSGLRSRETADLFLVLIMHLLKPGGRAAVVLPDGALSGEGVKTRIRERLLAECDLHTLVRLPQGVFAPYTGIATNLLFFTKGAPTQRVWYFEHRYPAGQKSYSKTKPIRIREFDVAAEWWSSRESGPQAWAVPVQDIRQAGFSLDFRNPAASRGEAADLKPAVVGLQAARRSVEEAAIALHRDLSEALSSSDVLDSLRDLLGLLAASPAEARQAAAALRASLLELALRGRLSQPSDSAALCDGVAPPRVELLNQGRNFALPAHWCWKRLGDVAAIVGGGTPKTGTADYWAEPGEGIPWLTPADMRELPGPNASRGRRDITEKGLRESSAQLLPKGAILFSSRAPIGYVAIAANPLATNQGFKSCVPLVEGTTPYLYWLLKALAPSIDRQAPGTTFREVSGRAMKNQWVPWPPLDEQQRMVEALDAAWGALDRFLDAVDKYDAAVVHALDHLQGALLAD